MDHEHNKSVSISLYHDHRDWFHHLIATRQFCVFPVNLRNAQRDCTAPPQLVEPFSVMRDEPGRALVPF